MIHKNIHVIAILSLEETYSFSAIRNIGVYNNKNILNE